MFSGEEDMEYMLSLIRNGLEIIWSALKKLLLWNINMGWPIL